MSGLSSSFQGESSPVEELKFQKELDRVANDIEKEREMRMMQDLQDQIYLHQEQQTIDKGEAMSWFVDTQKENKEKIAVFNSDRKFHKLKFYTEKELQLKKEIRSDGAMNFSRHLGLFSYFGSELPKILHDNVMSHVGITNIQGQPLLITESLYFSAEIYKEVTLKTYKDVVGQLDLEKMLKFCLDIARALRYLHLKKIAYRNLILERILLNENQAKLEHPAIVAPNEIHQIATYQDTWGDIQQFCSIFFEELSREYFAQTSNIILNGIITLLEEIIPNERCGISYDLSAYLNAIESSKNELKNEDLLAKMTDDRMEEKEDQAISAIVSPYDPTIEVIPFSVDKLINTTHNELMEDFKSLENLQIVDRNGQGTYIAANSRRFGEVLIKHLGNSSPISKQIRDLISKGVHPDAMDAVTLLAEMKSRQREIMFMSELSHPNITKILYYFSPSGTREEITTIVMEGAVNGVLDIYAKKQMEEKKIEEFTYQLACALDYLHEKNIIHRDIRPRNIYVHDTFVKLGNFGYAKKADNSNVHTANPGEEIYYKAPEMIAFGSSTATYSTSVDVYGLALVVWCMAHEGKKPFKETGVNQGIYNHHESFKSYLEESPNNRPPIRPNLSAGLRQLIEASWICESNLIRRPSIKDILAIFG